MTKIENFHEIIPFNDRKISTITLIVQITPIRRSVAAWILPWSYNDKYEKNKKDFSISGIYNIRCETCQRGMLSEFEKNKKPFQHTTTARFVYEGNKYSFKIYDDKIHICGCRSVEKGLDVTRKFISLVDKVRRRQKAVKDTHESVMKWIFENESFLTCQGQTIPEKPKHLRKQISWYLSFSKDYSNFDDFIEFVNQIPSIPLIADEKVEILNQEIAMYNINFNIGCFIDKEIFKRVFENNDEFIASTDPQCRGDVLVQLPYQDVIENRLTKRKRNKPPKHSFTVYKTGSVTQSGPGGALAEDAYNRFYQIVLDNYELIKI